MTTTPITPLDRARRRHRAVLVLLAAAVVAFAGAFAWLLLRGDDAPPATTASSSPPAAAAMVDGVDYWPGTNVAPGAYRQAAETPGCEWSVVDALTGEEVERGLPGGGLVTVNLGEGTRFRSSGCGRWVPAS